MNEQPKKKTNRVTSTKLVTGIMNNFYEQMLLADKVAWDVGACPYEMFTAANVSRFQTENHAARISARGEQDKFIRVAEEAGLDTDCCSYAKINIGQAIMMVRGEESQIPEDFRLPRPDMLFALNTCPTMIQWADILADLFNVPSFMVDAPFIYNEDDWGKAISYVKGQLEDLVVFLEKLTGKPYNWKLLSDNLHKIRQFTQYRRKGIECLKCKPAPSSFIDGCVAMGPGNTVRDDATLEFYKIFNDEIEERAKAGVGVLENEKYRLMWRGNFPWHKLGTISRMLTKYDSMIITGPYAFRCYGDIASDHIPPDGFDFSDPLKTIAADHCSRSYTRTMEWKLETEFRQFIRGFSIDGVIIHSPRTCRPWALGAYDMAESIRNEFELPVLVLESDHCDPQYFNDAQVENKIQALLETIDAKRQE